MLILISCVTHVGSHMLAILDNLTFYELYLINFLNLTYQQFFCLHVDIIILMSTTKLSCMLTKFIEK